LADTLFVTGRLAEPALRAVLSDLGIDHQIAVMNISVAALMTTRWIARRLSTPPGVDNIVIPGLCEGDVDALQQATGLVVRKGPADVRALPEWYGREAVRAQLGPRDVRVFAEINGVQSLLREQAVNVQVTLPVYLCRCLLLPHRHHLTTHRLPHPGTDLH